MLAIWHPWMYSCLFIYKCSATEGSQKWCTVLYCCSYYTLLLSQNWVVSV